MVSGYTRPMLIGELFPITLSTGLAISGSAPVPITNAHQLQLATSGSSVNYNLASNINLYSGMNNASDIWGTNQAAASGTGFFEIGYWQSGAGVYPYIGRFNGNNYQVQNLYMNYPAAFDTVGLFGNISTNGYVYNLGINNATINGSTNAGAFVGRMTGTSVVANSYATNVNVTASAGGSGNIGGFAGQLLGGVISNSYSSGAVNGGTMNYIGGFIGQSPSGATAVAIYSHSSANVSGATYLGGFIGSAYGSYAFDYATGAVTSSVTSATKLGGFAGAQNSGTISNSYSTGSVTGTGASQTFLGGFIGYSIAANVLQSYSTGNVTASGTSVNYVGGFAGDVSNSATFSYDYATGNVTANGTNSTFVGGFVGISEGGGALISYSYATGNVFGYLQVGGFIGVNSAQTQIYDYSTGSVTGNNAVGGFAGFSNTPGISYSYSTGAVLTTGIATPTLIGGFIGNYTSVSALPNNFWDTQTSGKTNACAGSGAANCSGTAGLTTAQTMTYSNVNSSFSGRLFSDATISSVTGSTYASATGNSAWFMFDGQTRPMLASEEFYLVNTAPITGGAPVTLGRRW